MAERAHYGFGCQILYHNRNERTDVDDISAKFYKELNEMLPLCDFICIVCNLTESTRNIIGDEQFRQV